ncbi:MAG: hypothetical protein IKI99_01780 [Firmicutes bacterium]|nr:hypothetical protein [Bacillota bacterium]
MKEKVKKIISSVIVGGFLIYCSYLTFQDGDAELDDIRNLLVMVFCSCTVLRSTFSTKMAQPVPEELRRNETYMEAKERQDSGGKILIAGVVMMVAPFVLLIVLGELHDFLASVSILAFFLGIFAILIGLLISIGAGKDMAKFPIETVQDTQPESTASRVFDCIGTLAAAAVLVLWIAESIILK